MTRAEADAVRDLLAVANKHIPKLREEAAEAGRDSGAWERALRRIGTAARCSLDRNGMRLEAVR